MITFLTEVRQTLAPDRSDRFGPLPPLFIVMTLVTGLVDSFSYLVLGHVFVANMTGNVVFLGFAVAGAHGFSIAASLTALVSFGAGSVIGGRVVARHGHHRGHHLAVATAVQSAFLLTAVALAIASSNPPQSGFRYSLIVVLSLATGGQNASAREAGGTRLDDNCSHHDGDGNRGRQCSRRWKGFQIGKTLDRHRGHVLGRARWAPCSSSM